MSNEQTPEHDLDAEVKRLIEEGRDNEAVTRVIHTYGRELLGFTINLSCDPHVGEELFQATCIKIWQGLQGFQWRSSVRTWVYTIARNAFLNHRRGGKGSEVERLQTRDLEHFPERAMRSVTTEWRKTETKAWLWDAINAMPDEDRTLLVLRLGRGMRWSDVARVMLDEEEPDKATLKRKVVALRKRYERLKHRIREKASERDDG